MYTAAACIACHRLGNLGVNATGPNLTQAGSRYTERDLLMSIIDPSDNINETYAATEYTLKDGSTLVGYPVFDEGGELFVSANLFNPRDLTLIPEKDIQSTRNYPHSLMPPGLINTLNPDELRDLIAFVLSGGNRSNPMFAR
jgi:putative heme-binding domain-containing protein